MNVRKVGSVIAGTAMLGAALAAPVAAVMDDEGLTKGFFYDDNYKPIVQIVVGEKSMGTDMIAGGNVAATIGNLAYMTKTVTPGAGGATAEGQVVITTSAMGAVGDYVQDESIDETLLEFYDADEGYNFENEGDEAKEYEQGDFTSYTVTCDQQERTEAGVLAKGTYTNIHCLFCRTLCIESLKNPSHEMKEKIIVDSEGVKYYENGIGDDDSEKLEMSIAKNSVKYMVDTDYIPLDDIENSKSKSDDDEYLDYKYKGKMIFLGDEYYLRKVDGDKLYLAKGQILDDLTSEGYTEYNGYKFKIDHLMYAEEYKVSGVLLEVQKPDGTKMQAQVSRYDSDVIDGKLQLSGVTADKAGSIETASVIVYDLESEIMLEDGEDLEIGGKVMEDWEVSFEKVDICEGDCDIDEYDDMLDDNEVLLESITVTYKNELDGDEALEKDESLNFPNDKYRITFKGYLTDKFKEAPCVGAGEGNIMVGPGDDAHMLTISFTADDGNRYDDVRLDQGPFAKNDVFIVDGTLYSYTKYEDDPDDDYEALDTVTVTIDPELSGSRKEIELIRYCNTEDDDEEVDSTFTGANCDDINDEVTVRALALYDAIKDDESPAADDNDADTYENDDNIAIEVEDLFVADDVTIKNVHLDVLFDSNDNKVYFFPVGSITEGDEIDTLMLTVNADMVGTLNDFDVDGYNLDFWIETEAGLTADPNSVSYDSDDDLNDDGDDDDILFAFETADGDVYVDMTDRNYNEDVDDEYSNMLWLDDLEIDNDEDKMLIVPEGGDTFTIDWASDQRIDSVEVCHPEDDVLGTYFIGTTEEETVAESVVTKADEGKTVSAGCCEFTVSKFDVAVSGDAAGPVETVVVNPVGSIVVSETAADTSMNLVVVGGPSVNGMSELTVEEIDADADKYIVKKIGSKLMVAGYEAEDTIAAGEALVAWLTANVH